ncbi:MAG: transposase [Bacteroidaceae bacterium]|nr:transposase [Bacteroidaceae bacterium]
MEELHYIGVDVSKHTLDIAVYDGCLDLKDGHIQVGNDSKGFTTFARWIKGKGIEYDQVRLCMEFTGLYAHEFRCWLEQKDITYYMIPPKKMHDFQVPTNIHGLGHVKTDRMDSYKIAIYSYKNSMDLQPSRLPSAAFFKLQRLMAERRQYVRQRQLYKFHTHNIGAYESDESRTRRKVMSKALLKSIQGVEQEIDNVISSDESIKKNYELLTSIISIGRVCAITTIVLTENFTAITNPRSYANYVCVAPYKKESGTSVRRKAMTSSEGVRQAKADLTIAALSAIRWDPGTTSYWKRKKAEGKHSGVVLNAIKFKLIMRMFAVVKRARPYVKMHIFGK